MSKVKILVACHKPDKYYSDNVYEPIQVGRAVSKYSAEMGHMIGDDIGDNISNKNPYYCELTAQYWAWRNLTDVEYIGLCHYRRYFKTKITSENVDYILGDNHDILLCKPILDKRSVIDRLKITVSLEDVYIFLKCLKKLYPDYYNTAESYLTDVCVIPYNMFLMRKDLFNQFAEWQFSILSEMEKYLKLSGYSRMRRVYGYIAETFLAIYSIKNNLRVKYDQLVDYYEDGQILNEGAYRFYWLKHIIFHLLYKGDMGILKSDSTIVGLRNDGIEI